MHPVGQPGRLLVCGRVHTPSCQKNGMTRSSQVPYSRASQLQPDQSCSPWTSRSYSSSSSTARSGVLFGSGRLTVFIPDQSQQSQCVISSIFYRPTASLAPVTVRHHQSKHRSQSPHPPLDRLLPNHIGAFPS